MKTLGFRKVLAVACLLGASHQGALAHMGESELQGHGTLASRAERARRSCLRSARSLPGVTFETPTGQWVEIYRPSTASRLTMGVYRPLTHGVGGLIQSAIDRAFGESEAFSGMDTLRTLGREARTFAAEHALSRMEALCVASCVVSELIYPTEDIPHMLSLDLALSSGAGDCKIYSEAMLVLAKEMRIPLSLATSWAHAFNRVSYQGRDYFVDATRFDGLSCNYIPVEFYN